jgi:hypothetical protein
VILVFAALFRVIHLRGNPIQEIDIYRYIWDGEVTRAGVNPFAYSPEEALRGAGAIVTEQGDIAFPRPPHREDGRRLAELLQSRSAKQVFLAVDHGQVPTVYPPASQATFALAAMLTPAAATIKTHVVVMKALFELFDFGSIIVLIKLLRAVGKSPHWCIVYAWCPLVIKEVANSGHLDVQAVFFTLLAALFLVKGLRYAGAVAWAAAILSKVYPVILLPLVVRQLWNHGQSARRIGAAVGPLLVACGLIAAAYFAVWPAYTHSEGGTTPVRGLRTFLTEWEMNDLLFHFLYQGIDRAWPKEAQLAFTERFGHRWPLRLADEAQEPTPVSPAFVLACALVGVALLGLGVLLAWRSSRPSPHPAGKDTVPDEFLSGVFYLLAILFLIGPTANPWYLLWAIPFLPWARLWVWLLLPGFVLQYYLYFWFTYHYPDPHVADGRWQVYQAVPGTHLTGREFFNAIWLWVEYLPFFILLGIELCWRLRRARGLPREPSVA